MAEIIVILNEKRIEVINGQQRLEAQLIAFGYATVDIGGKSVRIAKNEKGELVEIEANNPR